MISISPLYVVLYTVIGFVLALYMMWYNNVSRWSKNTLYDSIKKITVSEIIFFSMCTVMWLPALVLYLLFRFLNIVKG